MGAAVYAQRPKAEPQEELPTIKVDVELVNVMFTVRNKNNALISTLTKDDLAVYEDGKAQTAKYFTRETNLPLTIGLLVDVSGSQETLIPQEKYAAGQFFDQVLKPKDMAFLISFGADAELLQDSTNSTKLLKRGLEGLRLSTSVGGLHPGPVPTSKQKGTILYDAVYLAANEKLKSEVGRKAIVLITDGMDFGSTYKLKDAIEMAHRADTMIYSIYYVDQRAYYGRGFGGASDSDLKKMSEETGGRLFHVGRNNTLEDIFKQIQEEMRSQYALAYSPTNDSRDGSYRKLEIRPNDRALKVQARKGYYAAKG
ncbi:MAG: VWA domain-containing protein [Acidobacteria bacterium]|nr:VWA domain-containing protein [Acidobacteriota bacterium]